MFEDDLELLTINNQKIKIAASDVKGLQGFNGVHAGDIGGVPVAAEGYQYIELKTDSATYRVARNAQNDSQLLTFLLSHGQRSS